MIYVCILWHIAVCAMYPCVSLCDCLREWACVCVCVCVCVDTCIHAWNVHLPMRVYIHINTGSYPNKTYSKVKPDMRGAQGSSAKSSASISLLSDDEDQMVFDGGPSDESAILRQDKKTVSSPLFACRCRYQSCARSWCNLSRRLDRGRKACHRQPFKTKRFPWKSWVFGVIPRGGSRRFKTLHRWSIYKFWTLVKPCSRTGSSE